MCRACTSECHPFLGAANNTNKHTNTLHIARRYYNSTGLPIAQLRVMNTIKRHANGIIRTCVAQDPDGNGWVERGMFLDAICGAGVELGQEDERNVWEAMKGGMNKQGDASEFAQKNVRYSGMVHR